MKEKGLGLCICEGMKEEHCKQSCAKLFNKGKDDQPTVWTQMQ